MFYFDNPNLRAPEGDVVPFKDTTVTVTPVSRVRPLIALAAVSRGE